MKESQLNSQGNRGILMAVDIPNLCALQIISINEIQSRILGVRRICNLVPSLKTFICQKQKKVLC